VLAARQLGAAAIIAMSRHESRQKLALEYGATDIVTERGDDGVAAIKDLTNGLGRALGYRGRRHPGVDDAGHPLHPPRRARRLRRRLPRRRAARRRAVLLPRAPARRPAPVRRFLPELIDLIWNRTIDPGKVFDLTLPLDQAAEGYKAMDERRAIKTLLQP
jgi:threonine dehydrogenase-like Zn-dependent dehydrogenase